MFSQTRIKKIINTIKDLKAINTTDTDTINLLKISLEQTQTKLITAEQKIKTLETKLTTLESKVSLISK